jgi:hypothetical protein
MKKKNNYRNYFALNMYVANLKKIVLKVQNPRDFFQNADSITVLIIYKILIFFRTLLKYFFELFKGGKYLVKIFYVKKIKNKDYCIIFGRGPSLDSLKIKDLKKISLFFDIFVVNNFIENKIFSKIIPNFWVASDPNIFKPKSLTPKKKESTLASFLKKNININIFTPVLRCKDFIKLFGLERVFGFIDSEARNWSSNTLPIFPRGYVSATVLKAICIANWMDYKKIFVLGVDNTYPRDIFVNKKNRILNLENHSKSQNSVYDVSSYYSCVSKNMLDLYELFKDYKKINKKNNIYNLDQYSLTGYDKSYDIKKLLKKLSNRRAL